MLRPKAVAAYLPEQAIVAEELTQHVKELIDGNSEVDDLRGAFDKYAAECKSWRANVQSRLSYVTLQGTLMKRSHMKGGLLVQSPYNNREGKMCMTSKYFPNRMKSL